MFYRWEVKEVGEEWHVLEWHPMDDPDKPWAMAKCSGPVPAARIMAALQLEQGLRKSLNSAENNLRRATEEIAHFRKQIKHEF